MKKLFLCCLLLLTSFFNSATTHNIVIGQNETITSSILNETRKIQIYLPENYKKTNYFYPVLYLLDSETLFNIMTSAVGFLSKNDIIPPIIVVGIESGSTRTRDLTPQLSKEESEKKSWYSDQNPGGADKYIAFLERELIPYINKKYRTANFRVLSGHSFGGLFSLYAYLNRPDMFDGYMAISSSLWWDNERLVADAKQLARQNKLAKRHLFLSKGDEQGPIDTGYMSLVELFSSYNPDHTSAHAFPEENHLTVVFNAHYYGLKAIFREWTLPFKEGAKGIDVVNAHNEKVKNTFNVNFTSEGWLRNLGNNELYQKNYRKAIEAFKQNARQFPDSAYAYFLLAKAFEENQEITSAIESYQKAVDKEPSSSPFKKTYQTHLNKLKNNNTRALHEK